MFASAAVLNVVDFAGSSDVIESVVLGTLPDKTALDSTVPPASAAWDRALITERLARTWCALECVTSARNLAHLVNANLRPDSHPNAFMLFFFFSFFLHRTSRQLLSVFVYSLFNAISILLCLRGPPYQQSSSLRPKQKLPWLERHRINKALPAAMNNHRGMTPAGGELWRGVSIDLPNPVLAAAPIDDMRLDIVPPICAWHLA